MYIAEALQDDIAEQEDEIEEVDDDGNSVHDASMAEAPELVPLPAPSPDSSTEDPRACSQYGSLLWECLVVVFLIVMPMLADKVTQYSILNPALASPTHPIQYSTGQYSTVQYSIHFPSPSLRMQSFLWRVRVLGYSTVSRLPSPVHPGTVYSFSPTRHVSGHISCASQQQFLGGSIHDCGSGLAGR